MSGLHPLRPRVHWIGPKDYIQFPPQARVGDTCETYGKTWQKTEYIGWVKVDIHE